MGKNRGKQFEEHIREAFEKLTDVSIDRLHDQTNGFKGSQNICDFIVYQKPYEYYFECKSVHGNTLPFTNITDTQWQGLLKKSQIKGVIAGIICWWVDLDETWFIPIWVIEDAKSVMNAKSINLKHPHMQGYWTFIPGKKKRVFFEYDVRTFLSHLKNQKARCEK